jgi:hypothetical protein
MSLVKVGNVLADCGKFQNEDRRDYVLIGAAFADEDGRTVIKIDSLPLPSKNWRGWCNIFADKKPDVSE